MTATIRAIRSTDSSIQDSPLKIEELTASSIQELPMAKTEVLEAVEVKIPRDRTGKNAKNFKDMTGLKFGYLEVISYSKLGKWNCICTCGLENCSKTSCVAGYSLRNGTTKSCGSITKFKDLTGKIFNRLEVIGLAGKDLSGNYEYNCKCIKCGNYLVVSASSLQSGNTKSCGCLHKDVLKAKTIEVAKEICGKWHSNKRFFCFGLARNKDIKGINRQFICYCKCGEQFLANSSQIKDHRVRDCGKHEKYIRYGEDFRILKRLHHQYRKMAVNRLLSFELSLQEFESLIKGSCFYCGLPPNTPKILRSGKKILIHGIDRVLNNKGYIKSNCVTCCKEHNKMKLNYPLDKFLSLCSIVAKREEIIRKDFEELIKQNG